VIHQPKLVSAPQQVPREESAEIAGGTGDEHDHMLSLACRIAPDNATMPMTPAISPTPPST
jgi:hypothetical protein